MAKELLYFLALIGGAVLVTFIILIIILIEENISMFIAKKRYEYKRKHRFGKPPIAKCYCIDCNHWDTETGECYMFTGYKTADSWFCWRADPKEKEVKDGNN